MCAYKRDKGSQAIDRGTNKITKWSVRKVNLKTQTKIPPHGILRHCSMALLSF